MTITREQLELAAKAAGMSLSHWEYNDGRFRHRKHKDIHWEPDEDHGQLHDLAMACKIRIDPQKNEIRYLVSSIGRLEEFCKEVNCQDFHALAEAVILAASEMEQAKCRT